MRDLLLPKKMFLLGLLQNPNLLEHESFTDLLWALFHMVEEFEYRGNLQILSGADKQHLISDLNRVLCYLTSVWIKYLSHLKVAYPYLFAFSVKTNPFGKTASVTNR